MVTGKQKEQTDRVHSKGKSVGVIYIGLAESKQNSSLVLRVLKNMSDGTTAG